VSKGYAFSWFGLPITVGLVVQDEHSSVCSEAGVRRHKTRKPSFRYMRFSTGIIQIFRKTGITVITGKVQQRSLSKMGSREIVFTLSLLNLHVTSNRFHE
tara:strand:+ start:527 stop:826 length:300 start_codon:yes stop_codon:yes gene_type:complete